MQEPVRGWQGPVQDPEYKRRNYSVPLFEKEGLGEIL